MISRRSGFQSVILGSGGINTAGEEGVVGSSELVTHPFIIIYLSSTAISLLLLLLAALHSHHFVSPVLTSPLPARVVGGILLPLRVQLGEGICNPRESRTVSLPAQSGHQIAILFDY